MKYTYNIKSRDGNALVVSYTAEFASFPVIEKEISLLDGEAELLAIVSAAPVSQWALAHPEFFPPKPPGSPREFTSALNKPLP